MLFKSIHVCLLAAVVIILQGCGTIMPCATSAELRLASDGHTDYAVVLPDQPLALDRYAVGVLTNFLYLKTGTLFPVIGPDATTPTNHYIFIGLSAPALKIIGRDPLDALQDQEYVARTAGEQILLYGKGLHGNLHAVLDFMENTLGRRWFSGRLISESPRWQNSQGQPVWRAEPELVVKPFSRQGGFSFACRIPSYEWMFDFHQQSGMNVSTCLRYQPNDFSLYVMPAGCHTFFGYVPPSPQKQPQTNVFGWVEHKNYFETHPEYFSLWTNGKRVPYKQLCFSNQGLRDVMTKNILEHIRRLKAAGLQRLLLDVSAHDDVGEFCYCDECAALKEQYQAVGGPFYDYLFELCAIVKAQHPDVMLHTLAYRLSQTQKPPVMPAGVRFPDNLIVQFADVEDKCTITTNDISLGIYQLYPLGDIQVTPNCIVWFSSRSWLTQLQLGERLYSPPTPDNDNRYAVHISLKFLASIPPTAREIAANDKWRLDTNAPYAVLCDQIIFVKTPVQP